MDVLELEVVDYLQVGVTERKCMKILPNNEKRKVTQKVVVADRNGVLQCFGLKKREISSIFKLPPGPAINKVELGGALGTPQDKIFVASGAEVRGYSRKGKKFLDFNSNLTETISNLFISGSDLIVSGLYIYNHFSDCEDQGYYLSNDKINDLICLPTNRNPNDKLVPILACNDRNLRVLDGCNLKCEVEVSGTPQCIAPYKSNSDSSNELVYGTSDGKIGHVMLTENEPVYKWLLSNEKNSGGVSCLSHYDITGDGMEELLVGREDGNVEIYAYDNTDEPFLRYSHNFKESITSIQGGVVASLGHDEVLTSTYSGWVTGLTTERMQKRVSNRLTSTDSSEAVDSAYDKETANKLTALKIEVEALQIKTQSQRQKDVEKLRKSSAVDENAGSLMKAVTCHVNDNFKLNPSDASYNLSIEVQTSIDYVVIQTDVPIDLLDSDKTSAVVSRISTENPTKNQSHNYLLSTYRCQANTPRLEIKFRSIEGHYGHLQAYIVPQLHPKTAILRRYPVRPLSLHQRTHYIDDTRPMNTLKLSGPFSIAEIHSWVCFCLPDLPVRPPAGEDVKLYFCNTFLDTQLECVYKKGEGIFRSDNISTISILKDMLSKEATAKKIALNIHYDVNEDSISHTLRLLHPKMDYQFLLVKKVNLLDALQELQTHEGSMEFLAPEYQMVLENAAELKSEFLKQPSRLERLYGMITDLYIDKFKFKGINVKNKVSRLLEILDNYELPTLIAFFAQPVYS